MEKRCDRCGKIVDTDGKQIVSTNPPLTMEQLDNILKNPKYKTVMSFCPSCGKKVKELLETGELSICEIHHLTQVMNRKRGTGGI